MQNQHNEPYRNYELYNLQVLKKRSAIQTLQRHQHQQQTAAADDEQKWSTSGELEAEDVSGVLGHGNRLLVNDSDIVDNTLAWRRAQEERAQIKQQYHRNAVFAQNANRFPFQPQNLATPYRRVIYDTPQLVRATPSAPEKWYPPIDKARALSDGTLKTSVVESGPYKMRMQSTEKAPSDVTLADEDCVTPKNIKDILHSRKALSMNNLRRLVREYDLAYRTSATMGKSEVVIEIPSRHPDIYYQDADVVFAQIKQHYKKQGFKVRTLSKQQRILSISMHMEPVNTSRIRV